MDETSGHEEEKIALAAALRHHLQDAQILRERANAEGDGAGARDRLRLRDWQAARLARCYTELLASERYGRAAQFFLSDLYGPKDFSSRDEEVGRILPTLVRMLPASAPRTLALALELDALTEALDAAMVGELRAAGRIETIDEDAYAAAYRRVGRRAERERQIALIRGTGEALEKLAGKAVLSGVLRLMRRPAHLAGLGELQEFLENGFAAFRHMGDATDFLGCIETRERQLLARLFDGSATPFSL